MRMTSDFFESPYDLIAHYDGFQIIEPGRIYRKRVGPHSHLYVEKTGSGMYDLYKVKKTVYARGEEFDYVMKEANSYIKKMDQMEDASDYLEMVEKFIEKLKDLDQGDGMDDFSTKEKRFKI